MAVRCHRQPSWPLALGIGQCPCVQRMLLEGWPRVSSCRWEGGCPLSPRFLVVPSLVGHPYALVLGAAPLTLRVRGGSVVVGWSEEG